jgi:hypothetical protein
MTNKPAPKPITLIYNPCITTVCGKTPKILAIYEKDTKYQFSYLKPKMDLKIATAFR